MKVSNLKYIQFTSSLIASMKNDSFLHNFRCASNCKRSFKENNLANFKSQLLENNFMLTNSDWSNIRQDLIDKNKHINLSNVDAVILGYCNESEYLPAAKSYMKYLENEKIEPNTATLGRLLRIYYLKYIEKSQLSKESIEEILRICTDIRKKYNFLDISTCENLIHGLVATDRWKDSIELLEMMKLSSTPTTSAYCVIIVKAFDVGDLEIGWKLLREMVCLQKQPKCDVFISLLKRIAINKEAFMENFENLLKFLAQHHILISQTVADCIETTLKSFNYDISTTKLTNDGKCRCCGKYMMNVQVSDDEFDKLKESFLQKVLIRKDVFQKSSPEEVDKFIRFIGETKPYDCVIDGLNVAYSRGAKQSAGNLASLLSSVVRYFKEKNMRVLVLGREHMLKWPKEKMSYIYKNSVTFFTNNLTHDDPFLLYATIVSGKTTDFFSRDYMRSHAHLLGTDLKEIFRRWQQQHQYSLVTQTHDGTLIIKEPTRYALNAQKTNSSWHVPYKLNNSSNSAENFEIPESWLCIRL